MPRLEQAAVQRSCVLVLSLLAGGFVTAADAADPPPTGSFAFSFAVDLPGPPDAMYDALTGDVSGWWDHSMSGAPLALVIEPRPGGRFLETFDDSGDGVVHATVTYAKRGEKLQMVGPLGLAGRAIHMVTTWELAPLDGERSRLAVTVHASGEIHPGWDTVVEATWHHFIDERFVPWVTAGQPGEQR